MGFFDSFRRKKNVEREKEQVVEEAVTEVVETPDVIEASDTSAPIEEEIPVYEQEDLMEEEEDEEEYDEEEDEDFEPPVAVVREVKPYDQKDPVDHVIGETKVLAILNQKGGVGKSTTAVNLSAALGAQNKAVLLVDLDPQGNATSGLGIDKSEIKYSTYDVLMQKAEITDAIVPDVCKGLDVLPATITLAGAELELVTEMARENRLKSVIGPLRGCYDYIFFDCPPSLGLLTVNALVASDKLLIPIQTEFYALEGVTKLLESMERVKKMLNPGIGIFGVVLTMYDGRTTLSKQVADEVRNHFGASVFETVIPRTVKLSEAPSFGQPITEYDPSGKGARAYWSLAEEVINRG